MPTDITLQLSMYDLLIWLAVGLVAGFAASKLMLGHGLGLVADLAAGIAGAILGQALSGLFGVQVAVAGHPLVSRVLVACFGALVLLLLLRLVGLGRGRRRAY